LFIGVLSWDTSDKTFYTFFAKYGKILDSIVMRHPDGKSRGFGFITYEENEAAEKVVTAKDLEIDGRKIDPKRAIPKEEEEQMTEKSRKTRKVFIGGLSPDTTQKEFDDYFSKYGHIVDSIIMSDRDSGRSRGFGFVTYDTDDAVDKVVEIKEHTLHGKVVETKKAVPKDDDPPRRGGGGRDRHDYDRHDRRDPFDMRERRGPRRDRDRDYDRRRDFDRYDRGYDRGYDRFDRDRGYDRDRRGGGERRGRDSYDPYRGGAAGARGYGDHYGGAAYGGSAGSYGAGGYEGGYGYGGASGGYSAPAPAPAPAPAYAAPSYSQGYSGYGQEKGRPASAAGAGAYPGPAYTPYQGAGYPASSGAAAYTPAAWGSYSAANGSRRM